MPSFTWCASAATSIRITTSSKPMQDLEGDFVDFQRFEHRINSDAIAIADPVKEVDRMTVRDDQVDFGMRNAEALDQSHIHMLALAEARRRGVRRALVLDVRTRPLAVRVGTGRRPRSSQARWACAA
jgi:hypothetical protein